MNTSEADIRGAIADQAAEWFVANQTGGLDSRSRGEFLSWLRGSPVHVAEYLGIAGIARDAPAALVGMKDSVASLVQDFRRGDVSTTRPVHARYVGWLRAVTATVLLAGVGAAALWFSGSELWVRSQHFSTAHGEQQRWQLSDGSVLRLNTDSELKVRYARNERVVEVVRGQAYFQVAHESRRFRVDAAGASVVAVGTEFDVDRNGQSVTVTMIDGQVAVMPAGISVTSPGQSLQGAVKLLKGQQLRLVAGNIVSIEAPSDISAAVAWLNQQIVFERRPLSEVTDAFNRYSSVRIEVTDPELRGLQISGVFNSYDTDSFLTFIESLDGLAVERNAEVNRIVRRAPTPRRQP